MSLLDELFEEEGSQNILKTLLGAAQDLMDAESRARQTVDLNRFEVAMDGELERVTIFDVLEEDVKEEYSVEEFCKRVENRIRNL